MKQSLKNFLADFFALEILPGKKVRIPYWRNRFFKNNLRVLRGPYGGKGTPVQIKEAVLKEAKRAKISLEELSSEQIVNFMKQKKIGLDCSGLAFQVLAFLKPGFWKGLKKAPGRSRDPVRRFNSKSLCSEANSFPVGTVANIRVGDLIPLGFNERGRVDHLAVVVDKTGKKIVYLHSSNKTAVSGVHLAEIKIADSCLGLEDQVWRERSKTGIGLDQFYLEDKGVRRVRGF